MSNSQTIILVNGDFPKSEKLLKLLDNSNQIICCDGAVNKLIASGRKPHIIIGDLDSVDTEVKLKYKSILVHISEQDTNDLTKAVNWCSSKNIKEAIIMGATGKRADHTIANISLLSSYIELINIKLLTDDGVFIPITKTRIFNSFTGQQISIFSQDCNTKVSSQGLKYPLEKTKLSSWWMGTLNESIGDNFTISFENNGKIIVYLCNKR